jgi:TrmH family RNA methyltransferase
MAISKARLKTLRRLKQKKYRYAEQMFTAEGNKLVADLINAGWVPLSVFAHDIRDVERFPNAEMIAIAERKAIGVQENPSGVIAIFKMPKIQSANMLSSSALALYGIQDPGNLGTIIRTAAWFGHTQIVLLDGCVDPFNEKAIQASMGSIAHLNLIAASLDDLAIWKSDGYEILTADMHGEDVFEFEWPSKWLLLMGNEGQGFKGLQLNGRNVTIPEMSDGGPESLNVSIAAAVILAAKTQKMRL